MGYAALYSRLGKLGYAALHTTYILGSWVTLRFTQPTYYIHTGKLGYAALHPTY